MTTALTLVCHPSTRSNVANGIEVRARREQPDALTLHYVLKAEMPLIRVPPPAPASDRADGLWKHTCFEAFISVAGSPGYYELNFSPSRQWAIYRFSGYREGMSPVEVAVPPRLGVRRRDDCLEVEASVRLPDLDVPTLKLALSAVVEDDSGRLSYWALRHAPAKADFHHPDSFVLELPL